MATSTFLPTPHQPFAHPQPRPSARPRALSATSLRPARPGPARDLRRLAKTRSTGTPSAAEESDGLSSSSSENVVLRTAWYASELLGIAASLFRPSTGKEAGGGAAVLEDASGLLGRDRAVEAIKEDFERSYFVTGNLTLNAYEEECEFADPAGSFKGLYRFKRNCTNFGSLLVKSNMKLTKWEDFEEKGIGHWRFSCVMSFPWRPILSATGYTEYYFDSQSGKVNRHVEHWNVPKMALLKQIFRPTQWVWSKSAEG